MASAYYTDPDEEFDVDSLPMVILADATAKAAVNRLKRLNYLLHEAADEILDIQKELFGSDVDGNVLLRLYDCGVGCLGCPHVRWKKVRVRFRIQRDNPGKKERFLTQQTIKEPRRTSKVMREPRLRLAVDDAVLLFDARTRLLEPFVRLRRHITHSQIPKTNLALSADENHG